MLITLARCAANLIQSIRIKQSIWPTTNITEQNSEQEKKNRPSTSTARVEDLVICYRNLLQVQRPATGTNALNPRKGFKNERITNL